jgi:hypothetical protein
MAKVKIQGHASGTGVLTVTAPNTSTDRTITLPDATDTLIGTATTDALTTRVNGVGGRKNLIINGAMNVAQRGTSSTGFTNGGGGYKTVDRYYMGEGGAPSGVFTITQDTDAPDGFASSTKWDCTTADTSLAAADFLYIQQSIEAQDLQHLSYGTSGALETTMSFWVKSKKTGTYVVWFYQGDDGRHVQSQYTVDAADTWEKKTCVIPADTTGVIDNNNGVGFEIRFILGAGTNYTSGTAASTWASYTAANAYVGQTVNIADSTANYFNITGVQFETGSTATDFEHRSYGEELALCQRYYQRYGGTDNYFMLVGNAYDGDTAFCPTTLQTRMRAAPTFATSGTMSDYRYQSKSGDVTPAAIALDQSMEDCVALNVSTAGGALTAGHAVRLMNTVAAGYFEFIAEL